IKLEKMKGGIASFKGRRKHFNRLNYHTFINIVQIGRSSGYSAIDIGKEYAEKEEEIMNGKHFLVAVASDFSYCYGIVDKTSVVIFGSRDCCFCFLHSEF